VDHFLHLTDRNGAVPIAVHAAVGRKKPQLDVDGLLDLADGDLAVPSQSPGILWTVMLAVFNPDFAFGAVS
jgi:hypothetical protein